MKVVEAFFKKMIKNFKVVIAELTKLEALLSPGPEQQDRAFLASAVRVPGTQWMGH